MALDKNQKAVTDRNDKKRNKMYYKNDDDRELMRDSDEGSQDSSDPMNSDGYGEEDELAGEEGGPAMGFSVKLESDQHDDLGSPGPSMPKSKGLVTKLRKKGVK